METWDGRGFDGGGRKESLRDIKRRYPIAQVLQALTGKHTIVKSYESIANTWVSVSCPFHEDKKPSASMNSHFGRFHCHSCLTSGDIFDIVQQSLGLQSVREAADWITSNV